MDNKPKIKGLGNLKNAGSSLQKNAEKIKEQEKEFSTENNIALTFTLDKNLVLYVKELVFFKINNNVDNYFYNESEAVREGIELLGLSSPVPQRPEEIKNPTKRGRGTKQDKEIVKVTTSFLISEKDLEYIYNYIYHQQKGGGRFTKEEFFVLVVEKLEEKYRIKKETK